MKNILMIAALVTLLAACGEKPQSLGTGTKDSAPYSGAVKSFSEAGWTTGDKASWESQLKARAQYGQNDFTRAN